MEAPPPTSWLEAGGAYWVIWGVWVLVAGFYYVIAELIGRSTRTENDGCLLGIMNILLTLFGGGAGLLLFHERYPTFIATSMFGALIFPTAGTLFVLWRMKRKGVGRIDGP
jgi:hypothetical protein